MFTIRDVSRFYRTFSRADGSGEDHWDEGYVVLNARGEEVYGTESLIKAERFVALLNSPAKRRVA